MLKAVIDIVNDYPSTVVASYLAMIVLVVWFAVWLVTAYLTQQYSFAVAYALSVFLIFSFYWTAQGTEKKKTYL
jgi:hypothetical protein